MAAGIADDLATTTLLATDKPVLVAPAMNVRMWQHPATQENVRTLRERGILVVGPAEGDLACGETGVGRMVEPPELVEAVTAAMAPTSFLRGRRALVTAGPTHEPVDPVRYIANRSSGKQGYAVAASLAAAGAETTLVTGPTALADPPGVRVVRVESARQMLAACEAALPVDVAVCAAAVADWRVERDAGEKLKKTSAGPPALRLVENPDILATLAHHPSSRPRLVIGFAAETEHLLENAREKLDRKGCDWILANDVGSASGTFGSDHNQVHVVSAGAVESWERASKIEVARRLVVRIAAALGAGHE
jgi:phosphopantothenoylcysteine decarboxylase/phosphopantothenate--cysteine ligase